MPEPITVVTDMIQALLNKHEMDWSVFCQSPDVTLDLIVGTPELPWDFKYVSKNPNVTIVDVVDNYPDLPWNYSSLSVNPNITETVVFIEYPGLPWDYRQLSLNQNITYDSVRAYPDVSWYYPFLSRNPSIKLDNVVNNMDKPWDWTALTLQHWATANLIIKNHGLPWNWKIASAKQDLVIDYIVNPENTFLYDVLDWTIVSSNKNFDTTIAINNLHYPWVWEYLYR